MASAPRLAGETLSVSPVVHFPQEAEAGKTYLLTVDLSPRQAFDSWPYPNDEEVIIYCLINASPLFSTEPLGEPAVVIHRFGGTYGPARFLITAAAEPSEGIIRITLVNGLGVPLTAFETPVIKVRDKVKHKEVLDFRVRPRAEAPPAELPTASAPEQRWARKPARIFISSTFEDLQEHRRAIASSLRSMGHEVLLMEESGAAALAPLYKSYEDLSSCDLYIGILAFRYGYVPRENNPEQLSITELEYRHARAKGLPCLLFLQDEEARWPRSQIESSRGAQKLEALRRQLMSEHVVSLFSSVEQLVTQVSAAVENWSQQQRRRRRGVLPAAHLSPRHISISRLPVTGPDFFGRERELEFLNEAWADTGTHVVSIVAWGGTGKSALVNLWLTQMAQDDYRGAERVYGWSFYSQGTTDRAISSDQFIEAALSWFGDTAPNIGSPWDKGERLGRLVGAQCVLLVLDGLEPLQHPPGYDEGRLKDVALQSFLLQLAAHNEGLCVITTRIPVSDLNNFTNSTVATINLEMLSPQAGEALLRAHGVTGSQAELEAATREFGGHPLALALLGGYLSDVYGGDITRRVEISGLTDDARLGQHAERMLSSYERWLGEGPELAVLRILGLSKGSIEEAATAALRAAPPIAGLTEPLQGLSEARWQQLLSRLRRAGLLAAASPNQPGLLSAHPLVYEHFGSSLKRLHLGAWRKGHKRLYEHYKLTAKEFPDTLEEMAPLYSAVYHGCAAGRHQEALDEIYHRRILRGDQLYNQQQLRAFSLDLTVLSNFFSHPWSQVVEGLDASSQRLVLTLAGRDLRALGRLHEAAQPSQTSLRITISQQQWTDAAIESSNLSEIYLITGDLAQALTYAQQGVEFSGRTGYTLHGSDARATLAHAHHQAGRLQEAEKLFHEAESLWQQTQSQYPFFYSAHGFHYCELLLDQAKYQEVLERANLSLQWAERQRRAQPQLNQLAIALPHLSIGHSHLLQSQREATGGFEEAAYYLNRAVDDLRRAGTLNYLPYGLLAYAELYRVTGDLDRASADLDEAMSIVTRGSMGLHEADCHLGYARLYLAQGERELARESWARAREMIERMGYHRRDAELHDLEEQLEEAEPKAVREGLFIAYSHKDKEWLDRLMATLKSLPVSITTWDDTRIQPSQRWRSSIQRDLAFAKVALLLVSADFLASDFIADHELPPLLEAAGEGLEIIWIVVRPCLYEETFLTEYQAANVPAKPLAFLSGAQLDQELLRIGKVIERAIGPVEALASIIDRLLEVSVLAPLTAEEVSQLAAACTSRIYAAGETIIHEGELGDSMFVIHRGRAGVQVTDNGRLRTVATLKEGDFFGEMALLVGRPRSASVVAVEDSEVLEVGHAAMKQLFESNPTLVESIGRFIDDRLGELMKLDTRQSQGDEPATTSDSIRRFFSLAPSQAQSSDPATAANVGIAPLTEMNVLMFTDQVVSATVRLNDADAIILKQVQRDLVDEIVRQGHGAILKETGDGYLLTFPFCSTAVRCGFILQQRILELNETQDAHLKLRLRIGIAYGGPAVSQEGVFDNTANIAARICSAAPAGEVYFDENVMKGLNPSEAEFERVGDVNLEGISNGIALYRLTQWRGFVDIQERLYQIFGEFELALRELIKYVMQISPEYDWSQQVLNGRTPEMLSLGELLNIVRQEKAIFEPVFSNPAEYGELVINSKEITQVRTAVVHAREVDDTQIERVRQTVSLLLPIIYKAQERAAEEAGTAQSTDQSKSKRDFKYDVFISYRWISPDKEWVQEHLYPSLVNAGLEVFLDVRDFTPGRDLILELERAGLESRYTLCVISPDYFEEGRSVTFEALISRRLDPAGRQSFLIPLIYRATDIPDQLRGIIPVDWSNPELRTREWKKLLRVLGAENLDTPPPVSNY